MSPVSPKPLRCAVLLAAAVAWLVSVTLCAARMLPEAPHEHPVASEHSDHAHGPTHDHDGGQQDAGCGCESFKEFPAQTAALAKAPAPDASFVLYTILLDEFTHVSAATSITAQNTGPPGRISFDELVLQRCRLSHAPPFVV